MTDLARFAPGVSNIDAMAQLLSDLAADDRNLLVVTSDSRGSGKLSPFAERYPGQLVEVGIAEQALVGIACGLAASGKRVFAVSPAAFLTARALEQIKNDAAYSNNPVTLIGISAGVSYGALGSTHHALHDLAALQAIPNLDIVVPADNAETRTALVHAYRHPHPCYIRLGKQVMPADLAPGSPLVDGRARWLTAAQEQYAAAILACGELAHPAVKASELLAARGLSACVLSLPYLRPFDEQAVLDAARRSRAVLVAEEHSINGGLGSRVAALLLRERLYRPFEIAAFPDQTLVTGSQAELFTYYQLDTAGLLGRALRLLEETREAGS
ncbi:MAG: transketolase family protein [Anaerolineae bacterium]